MKQSGFVFIFLLMWTKSLVAGQVALAAASSLAHVLPGIVSSFKTETGHSVRVSYGSSGNLARQIVQGAPFELFLSANESYVARLQNKKLTRDEGVVYAFGELALYKPNRFRMPLSSDLSTLSYAIQAGQIKRIAIANPKHAPYGMLTKQALESAGLWKAIEPYRITGSNAGQAAQFALSGSVDVAFIPKATALLPIFKQNGQHVLLEEKLYSPLKQRMVLLLHSGEPATSFYRYMQSRPARMLLAKYGFGIPELPAELSGG